MLLVKNSQRLSQHGNQERVILGNHISDIMAARCGCVTANYPTCPVNQNPYLCTMNLLRSADEYCACYNFCGNEFHSCAEYPGQLLTESDCPEGQVPITGCNRALATSQRCNKGSLGACKSTIHGGDQSSLRRGRL